jgi:hypothetical protein
MRRARLAWMGAGRLAIVRPLVVEACCSLWAGARALRWRAGASIRCWRSRRRVCCACPQLSVNQRVLLYALGLSVLAGIVVGLKISVWMPMFALAMSFYDADSRSTVSDSAQP